MEDNDGGALPKKGNVLMLHDKRFNSNVLRFEHSPTMDLLAVALSDKSIAVHRSVSAKFQRLLSISTGNDVPTASGKSADAGVSSMAWKPNGKVIALGQHDGSIALHSVESGASVNMPLSAFPHSTSVTSLSWVEPKMSHARSGRARHADEPNPLVTNGQGINYLSTDGLQRNDYGSNPYRNEILSNYLPGPPNLSERENFGEAGNLLSTSANKTKMRTKGKTLLSNLGNSSIVCDSAFDILVSGDSSGVVTLSAYGFFPVGCIDLSAAFESYSIPPSKSTKSNSKVSLSRPTVINVSLSPDLQILSVVLRAKILDAESNDRNPDKDGTKETLYRYHLVIIDTSLLWTRRNEL